MSLIREKFYYKCDNIFEGVNQNKLKLFTQQSKRIKIKKNNIVMKEGASAGGVYYLEKGKIKIYQLTAAGKFQIVYIYTKGEYFGFRPILSNSINSVTAEAIEDCDLVFYTKTEFLKLMNSSPVLMKNLLYSLSYEFNIWVNRTAAFSHKSVKERVALALLILNEKYKKNLEDNNATINFGREDLASLASTTTETAVRILTQFKDDGLISSNGRKIKIKNEQQLINLAQVL